MLEKLDVTKKMDKKLYKEEIESRRTELGKLQRECRELHIPVMITFRKQKHLCLLLQSPERFAVKDPIPVPLKSRAHITFRFFAHSAPRLAALCRIRT